MAKRSIKKKKDNEPDFEIPENVQTETAQENADSENVATNESTETNDAKSPAEKEYDKMMLEFESPLPDSDVTIITETEKGKRGRKKKVFEEQNILIPGELVVAVVDNLGAGGLSLIDKWVSKNPLPIESLSLTEKQAEKLAPLAEKAIESLQLAKDPLSAFLYTYAAMSISNFVVLKAVQKKQTAAQNVKPN